MLHQACHDMFFPIADETAQMMDTLKEWFPQLDDVMTRRILKKYGPPPEDGGIGELSDGDMELVMQVSSAQAVSIHARFHLPRCSLLFLTLVGASLGG